ncbi:hypothetical protein RCL1_008878 [Eukaryota sp. TZLM3-RCL]
MSKSTEPYELLTDLESFSSFLNRPGVLFLEVSSTVWGRCGSVISTVRRFKSDFSGKGISFGLVDAENTGGRFSEVTSSPRFILFKNGNLVHDFMGLNVPLLQESLESLL